MKAIATLAVLGVALASDTKQNPRFRVDKKVVTLNNNKGDLTFDFDRDFDKVPGVKTTHTTTTEEEDWMKYVPAFLRDHMNVKSEVKVFEAKNNKGALNIVMNDDEFMVAPKPINRRKPVDQGIDLSKVNGSDDELALVDPYTVRGGRHTFYDDNDDELAMVDPYSVRGGRHTFYDDNDDEYFLDFTHKGTKVNANHNSGMANINIQNKDDADNELAFTAWKTDDVYRFPNNKNGLDYIHIKTDNKINEVKANGGVIVMKDDADDEFIGVTWKNKDINGAHNSGQMDINIHHDDADNELPYLGTLIRKP